MKPMGISISTDYLLLVEGKDEVNLFTRLIDNCLGNDVDVQVLKAGGREQFRRNLSAIREAARERPSLRAIGVVRDADDNPDAGFESVRDSVAAVGYLPPARHAEFSGGNPSIGIFITPDGESGGAIETVCRRSLDGHPAIGCVDEYLECARRRDVLHATNEDKSFVHAYLATLHDPLVRVGEAALAGVWDFQRPEFGGLVRFVDQLRGANRGA